MGIMPLNDLGLINLLSKHTSIQVQWIQRNSNIMKAGDVFICQPERAIDENGCFDLILQICPKPFCSPATVFETVPGFKQQPSSALHRSASSWAAVIEQGKG